MSMAWVPGCRRQVCPKALGRSLRIVVIRGGCPVRMWKIRAEELGARAGVANISENIREMRIRWLGYVERIKQEHVVMETWEKKISFHLNMSDENWGREMLYRNTEGERREAQDERTWKMKTWSRHKEKKSICNYHDHNQPAMDFLQCERLNCDARSFFFLDHSHCKYSGVKSLKLFFYRNHTFHIYDIKLLHLWK